MIQANYEAIRQQLFKRIYQGGEELKNDLPNILRSAITTKAWEHFQNVEGQTFENLVDWLMYEIPQGVALGKLSYALTYEDLITLTEGVPEVQRVLLEHAPKRSAGRPKCNVDITLKRHGQAASALTLSMRLAQEKPQFYEAYTRGRYRSVTSAAVAAGLIRDDANLRRLRSAYRRLTKRERRAFWVWSKTADAWLSASRNGHSS